MNLRDSVLGVLCRFPYGLTTQELISEVYRGAKEPAWAYQCIHVTVHRINKEKRGVAVRFSRRAKRAYQLWFT